MNARSMTQFILVVLIWGTTWIVIRSQLGVVDPSWSVSYRFLIGGVTLLGWCAVRGLPLHVPRSGWGFLAVFGILQFVLNFNFVYRAELYIASGLLAVGYALLMVPNAIFARIFLKSPISPRFMAGSALGVLGVGLLLAHEFSMPTMGGNTALGVSLMAAGVLAASASNVMQATPTARALPPLAGLGWAMLLGAVINAGIAYAVAGPPQWDPRPEYLAGLLMLGVIASAVAFALYFDLVRTIGPAEAAWTGIPIPIMAMALSTMFEGYRWSALAFAGVVIALAGLVVALRQPPTKSVQA